MLISKKKYLNWTNIQNEFDDYKASLDFDSIDSLKEYMRQDYKLSIGDLDKLINPIINSKLDHLELIF